MYELNMDLFGDAEDEDNIFESANDEKVDDNESSSGNPFEKEEEEIKVEDIFNDGDSSESKEDEKEDVEENKEEEKEEEKNESPKTKFYSSAVKALKEDGILPDLDDDFVNSVKTPEDFAAAIEKQIEARLDEKQKRINAAIESGVDFDEVRQYESVIERLNSITEDSLSEDTTESEDLRRRVIYQDFINRGFKPERAKKEVEKSFNAGTDIDDAKLALEENKEFYKEKYNDLLENAKEQKKKLEKEAKEAAQRFSKKILETEEPFSGIKIDKATRQKVLENSSVPRHKGSDGSLKTEIQKYFESDPEEAQYKLGVLFTMTDGFKNLDKLINKKVAVEKKSKIRELEHKLKNTPLNGDGSVDFGFGSNDEQSFFSGIKVDI